MNEIIAKIAAEETSKRIHAISTAYLAGHITKAERDQMLLMVGTPLITDPRISGDDLATDATGARYVPWTPGTCGDPNPTAY